MSMAYIRKTYGVPAKRGRVVCPDCGCAGATSVDKEGAYVVWRDDEALTDAALAGLRRLLRMNP